jgi:hypothetical protein
MKKLLIATTALVATAGMASADITITGHAAAGIYSGLSNKDGTAAVKAVNCITAAALQLAVTAAETYWQQRTCSYCTVATAKAAAVQHATANKLID